MSLLIWIELTERRNTADTKNKLCTRLKIIERETLHVQDYPNSAQVTLLGQGHRSTSCAESAHLKSVKDAVRVRTRSH